MKSRKVNNGPMLRHLPCTWRDMDAVVVIGCINESLHGLTVTVAVIQPLSVMVIGE